MVINLIDQNTLTNFITSIRNYVSTEITNHANTTSSSETKGHVKAGGVPQNISSSGAAGTDNGYYARADHVHKASFNDLADKPSTFIPSAHTHTINNITNLQSALNDKADEEHTHSQEDVSFVGSTEIWQGLGSNKNIGEAIEYVMWFFENHNHYREIYPVGSIYMSVDVYFSPSQAFGGTWERIKGRFLIGADDTSKYPCESTGGEEKHTLTKDEMPSHNHTQAQHRHKQHNKYSNGSGSAGAYVYSSNRTAVDHYTDYQTPTINNTGGGQAHNNIPPYLAVAIWKRVS